MKKMWTAGVVIASALALAACGGGGNKAGNTSGNSSAGNSTAPAGGSTSSGGNSATGNESAGGGEEQGGGGGAQQDFTIVNNTGQAVMTLNVSPSDSNNWGPDILGRDVLNNGEQAQIQFARGQEQCNWDIRATFQGGGTGDWRNINLCETTTITLTANQ